MKVAKTTLVQDNGLTWDKEEVQNYSAVRKDSGSFCFEGNDDLQAKYLKILDYKCDRALETVQIPVHNNSQTAINLKKGYTFWSALRGQTWFNQLSEQSIQA